MSLPGIVGQTLYIYCLALLLNLLDSPELENILTEEVGPMQVPSLPPITAYVHVDYGMWINSGTVFVEDRPPVSLNDLSWDPHGIDHYLPGIQTANGTTVPPSVLQIS